MRKACLIFIGLITACVGEDPAPPTSSGMNGNNGANGNNGTNGAVIVVSDAGLQEKESDNHTILDAGGVDASETDASEVDAGGTDAGGTDAGGIDAGGTDAGGIDGGKWYVDESSGVNCAHCPESCCSKYTSLACVRPDFPHTCM